jgi:hypothetical protein
MADIDKMQEAVAAALEAKAIEQGVPEITAGSIARYVVYHIDPGGFMTDVLRNDLKGSFGSADIENRYAMFNIVSFLYNNVPGACWGDHERVIDWLSGREVGE